MKTPLVITTLLIIASSLLHALAQANENPYYSSDLDAAVRDAEDSPNNMKYVGNRWYNRSTSKSFDFPKLLNKEMSIEVVDGALDATASGPGDVAPKRTSPLELDAQEVIANKQDDSELDFLSDTKTVALDLSTQTPADIAELGSKVYKVDKIEYRTDNFSGSATDIRAEASSRAYYTLEP
jgi:hypothetical protein